jgi:hypothetical protein
MSPSNTAASPPTTEPPHVSLEDESVGSTTKNKIAVESQPQNGETGESVASLEGQGVVSSGNSDIHDRKKARNAQTETTDIDAATNEALTEKVTALSLDIPDSSTSRMDPEKSIEDSSGPPPPPPKDEKYIRTSGTSRAQPEPDPEKEAYKREEMELEDGAVTSDTQQGEEIVDDTRSEIQSIMEQFDEGMGGPGADEIMSPRMEIAGPLLGSPMIGHPPRKSSLEPLSSSQSSLLRESSSSQPPPRSTSLVSSSSAGLGISQPSASSKELPESPPTPLSSRQHAPLPPRPDPDPDLPFDFHRFLEQLRHRTADPVAKFLRSFLQEFGKKQWMVHEQVKIISDFLEFISKKMAICDVWRSVSDAEFDNACEGMEKLVMNRLYSQTFSPAIPPPEPVTASGRGKRRTGQIPSGRRGQHQEDVERDEILAQKVRIYSWVREEHLDINPLNEKGKKFLILAQQGEPFLFYNILNILTEVELLKIGNYRAPRDKVICVLNCCKVIFGML